MFREQGKRLYYYKNDFDDAEIRILIDAVKTCSYLATEDVVNIVQKLINLQPRTFEYYRHFREEHEVRDENSLLIQNVDYFNEIIRNKNCARITFRKHNLIQKAIELNEQYAKEYNGERDWDKLSGFLKSSNISAADFKEVLAALPQSMDNMELAELEHIRWCRFHYLNYWEMGTFEDGMSKDNERRLHKDLIPFDQLGKEEKNKDLVVVEMARHNL